LALYHLTPIQANIDGRIVKRMISKLNSAHTLPDKTPLYTIALNKTQENAKTFRQEMIVPFLNLLTDIQNDPELQDQMPAVIVFDIAFSNLDEANANGENYNEMIMDKLKELYGKIPLVAIAEIFDEEKIGRQVYVDDIVCNPIVKYFDDLGRGAGKNLDASWGDSRYLPIQSITLKDLNPDWMFDADTLKSKITSKKCIPLLIADNKLNSFPYNISWVGYYYYRKIIYPNETKDSIEKFHGNLMSLYYFKELTPSPGSIFNDLHGDWGIAFKVSDDFNKYAEKKNLRILANKIAGKILLIGGIEDLRNINADIRTTSLNTETPGMFIVANAIASLHTNFQLGEKNKPVLIKYGPVWYGGFSLLFVILLFAVYKKTGAMLSRRNPKQANRILLTTLLVGSMILFFGIYFILAFTFKSIIYDVSVILAVILFTVFMLNRQLKDELFTGFQFTSSGIKKIISLIHQVNEACLDRDNASLFRTEHPNFYASVNDCFQSIHKEEDYRNFIISIYNWFYDGTGALKHLPEEFKEIGLEIKVLRVNVAHNPKPEMIEWRRQVLKKYIGKPYLNPEDISQFKKLQSLILNKVENDMKTLIRYLEEKLAD
jgi:hypothetical protein